MVFNIWSNRFWFTILRIMMGTKLRNVQHLPHYHKNIVTGTKLPTPINRHEHFNKCSCNLTVLFCRSYGSLHAHTTSCKSINQLRSSSFPIPLNLSAKLPCLLQFLFMRRQTVGSLQRPVVRTILVARSSYSEL